MESMAFSVRFVIFMPRIHDMKTTKAIIISGVVFMLSLVAGILTEKASDVSPEKLIDTEDIEAKIEKQTKLAEHVFSDLNKLKHSENPEQKFLHVLDDYHEELKANNISIYVFRDSVLSFWSDRLMPVQYSSVPEQGPVVAKKSNGFYIMIPCRDGEYTKLAAILLKRRYTYKNENLPPSVSDAYDIPDDVVVDTVPANGKQIYHEGKYLFSLNFNDEKLQNNCMFYASVILYFIAFISMLVLLGFSYAYFSDKIGHQNVLILAFLADLVIIRFLMLHFNFPGIWLEMDLFSPVYYAESVMYGSLGGMMINVMMLLSFSIVFFRFFRLGVNGVNPVIQFVLALVVYAFIFFLIYFGIYRIHGLIMNSTIPLDFSNLMNLSYLSFVVFIVILLLIVSLLIISDRILCETRKTIALRFWMYAAILFAIVLVIINWLIANEALSVQSFIFSVILAGIPVYVRVTRKKFSYYVLLGMSIAIAALFTCVINDFVQKKEREQARILAMNLSNERDAGAEYFIKEMNKDICEDDKLVKLLEKGEYEKAHEIFYTDYMRGYLEKYDVQLTLCNLNDSLIVSPNDELMHCHNFFKGMSETYGISLPGTDFYFLDNNNGRISYHGQIPVGVTDSLDTTIFIDIESKVQIEGPGYPELLLDQSLMPTTRDKVSYGKYYEGSLISSVGEYDYPDNFIYKESQTDLFSFESDDMWHLTYHPDDDNYIIVSYPVKGWESYSIFFTYIFFVLFILMNLVYLTDYILRRRSLGIFGGSLKNRFQTYLLLIFSLTLIVISIVSISFYIRKYRDKQKDAIEEKMQSVLVELNHKLGEEQSLNADMQDYLNYLLVKFSNVFYTDINLFDLDGKLLASSRMEIYDKGLVGKRMDPEAYNRIRNSKEGYFVQNEKIGEMEYLSAYLPFHNIHGEAMAYINLPYFARQSDFSKEISSLTVALLNVYLIMFIFVILIAIITSNQLTRPLRMLQDRLRLMDISKRNRKIPYAGDDEIGSLVQEYNRKVDELADSAEKLAKSERESAWREMAKQIAHEIKNPLTPMKLSVQHLENAYKENDPDFDVMFERVSKTLIEQIDSLANIATEFSNFARIRLKKKERVDLVERISQIKHLFSGLSSTRIVINNEVEGPAWILADKEQVIRMLNNLLKNALQSIPSGSQGIIRISLFEKNNHYLLSIADNGVGISNDVHEKIFSPSFTTKTSGMGLGLSIVKGIVDNMDGRIYYETEKNKGTEFFIEIPKSRR